MSEDIFIIKNYLKCMEFSINYQTYFEINYEQTKEFYNSIHKLLKEIEEGSKKVKQLEKEIEDLKEKNAQLTNYLNDSYYVSADKIKEKIDKYRKKIEKLHSQELWNEPEDSIKDFKYNHYLEAYKELLEENKCIK